VVKWSGDRETGSRNPLAVSRTADCYLPDSSHLPVLPLGLPCGSRLELVLELRRSRERRAESGRGIWSLSQLLQPAKWELEPRASGA